MPGDVDRGSKTLAIGLLGKVGHAAPGEGRQARVPTKTQRERPEHRIVRNAEQLVFFAPDF